MLWDEVKPTPLEVSIAKRGRYATPHRPGTGPEGETCGTCGNLRRVEYHDKRYLKCECMRELWSNGPGTDIRAKWPACKRWMIRYAIEENALKEGDK